MKLATRTMAALVLAFAVGCGGSMTRAQRHEAARSAVAELQAGRFDVAEAGANTAIDKDSRNAEARLVHALVTYIRTSGTLYQYFVASRRLHEKFDVKSVRGVCEKAESDLASIEEDLAVAAKDESVALELCLACWKVDWNHNGTLAEEDEVLFDIERDAEGKQIPKDDPRRKPTFRFDIGDVYWARAMIAYQRSLLDLVLAYRFEDLEGLAGGAKSDTITVRLADASRMKAARKRILEGLDHSDRAREEYLAEKDDDREWVPNPHQVNHPLPLPVDDALYDTWKGVVRDVRHLMESDEGIDLAELAHLSGDKQPVHGFLDLGQLLSDPHDIVLDTNELKKSKQNPDHALKLVFGDAYVSKMTPSPLVQRLHRMNREVDKGEDSFARKLRYLFWLN